METIHFDQRGDVRFIVKQDEKTIGYVVNSAILRLASPVFAALLGPHFAEGHLLSKRTPHGPPVDIELFDDNAEALKVLLDIMHMRQIPDKVKLPLLLDLATLIDKYQCPRACQSQAESWIMRTSILRKPWSSEFAELLGLAIVFGSGEIYALVSIGLALTSRRAPGNPKSFDVPSRLEGTRCKRLIPDRTVSDIKQLAEAYVRKLLDELVQLARRVSRKVVEDPSDYPGREHSLFSFCAHDQRILANYYGLLAHEGLLVSIRPSPMELLHKLCSVADALGEDPSTESGDLCSACSFVEGIEEDAYNAINSALSSQDGLLLDSIAHGQRWSITKPRTSAGSIEHAGVSRPILQLFQCVLGNCLLGDGKTQSFDILLTKMLDKYDLR